MVSRDSEDKMWSRFVIWPQEVTLVRWTQSSGPLCLWQCFDIMATKKSAIIWSHLGGRPNRVEFWTHYDEIKSSYHNSSTQNSGERSDWCQNERLYYFTSNFCLFQWTFQGLAPIPPIPTSFQFSKGLWLVVEGFWERHEQCKVVFDFD